MLQVCVDLTLHMRMRRKCAHRALDLTNIPRHGKHSDSRRSLAPSLAEDVMDNDQSQADESTLAT